MNKRKHKCFFLDLRGHAKRFLGRNSIPSFNRENNNMSKPTLVAKNEEYGLVDRYLLCMMTMENMLKKGIVC